MNNQTPRFVFFGTPDIAVWVLEELEESGLLPSLIVTNPDAPKGRKMVLTPPPVKVWALEHGIPFIQPTSLKDDEVSLALKDGGYDFFVVAAYGKIIPQSILSIPPHGILNVHPSLLPLFRGASPIRSAILNDVRGTGVTIMLMDEELDHGPILAQKQVYIDASCWPLPGRKLDELLAREGGALLACVIPEWLDGKITPKPQVHEQATFCTKITKEMGELDLTDDPYKNLLKIRAFDGWPGTYFFVEKNGTRIRVKVLDAELKDDGTLKITRVIPEGKKEISYTELTRQ